jgi:hypothetical protein
MRYIRNKLRAALNGFRGRGLLIATAGSGKTTNRMLADHVDG